MNENNIEKAIPLKENIKSTINAYLSSSKTDNLTNLHEMVLEQIEPPLLDLIMAHCRYNQSKAARMLGISRTTIRTKLIHYFDDKYVALGAGGDL